MVATVRLDPLETATGKALSMKLRTIADYRALAHHEVAHVVTALVQGCPYSVLVMDHTDSAKCYMQPSAFASLNPDDEIVVDLAGWVAEERWQAENPGLRDLPAFGYYADHDHARYLLNQRQATLTLDQALIKTRRLVLGNWRRISAGAQRVEARSRHATIRVKITGGL
jgi:hypothetical protein